MNPSGYQGYLQTIGQGGGGITITDLLSGVDEGTALDLGGGLATVVTAIDLTGIAVAGDLVVCSYKATNTNALNRRLEFYSDAAGNFKLIPEIDWINTGAIGVAEKSGLLLVRVFDPALSMFYAWSLLPTGGAQAHAMFVVSGGNITWL